MCVGGKEAGRARQGNAWAVLAPRVRGPPDRGWSALPEHPPQVELAEEDAAAGLGCEGLLLPHEELHERVLVADNRVDLGEELTRSLAGMDPRLPGGAIRLLALPGPGFECLREHLGGHGAEGPREEHVERPREFARHAEQHAPELRGPQRRQHPRRDVPLRAGRLLARLVGEAHVEREQLLRVPLARRELWRGWLRPPALRAPHLRSAHGLRPAGFQRRASLGLAARRHRTLGGALALPAAAAAAPQPLLQRHGKESWRRTLGRLFERVWHDAPDHALLLGMDRRRQRFAQEESVALPAYRRGCSRLPPKVDRDGGLGGRDLMPPSLGDEERVAGLELSRESEPINLAIKREPLQVRIGKVDLAVVRRFTVDLLWVEQRCVLGADEAHRFRPGHHAEEVVVGVVVRAGAHREGVHPQVAGHDPAALKGVRLLNVGQQARQQVVAVRRQRRADRRLRQVVRDLGRPYARSSPMGQGQSPARSPQNFPSALRLAVARPLARPLNHPQSLLRKHSDVSLADLQILDLRCLSLPALPPVFLINPEIHLHFEIQQQKNFQTRRTKAAIALHLHLSHPTPCRRHQRSHGEELEKNSEESQLLHPR
mmetsp:Transcript_39812/g.94555  ORF Transcript_39812/g.94555 Transcript_39812/m.94555 type:complete len:600 (+) Transcript_39812:121-1920(+)